MSNREEPLTPAEEREEESRLSHARRYEARPRDEVAVGVLPKLINYSPMDSARESWRKHREAGI